MCLFLMLPRLSHGYDRTIEDGRTVKIDYTLRVDGKVLESTVGKEPLTYEHGNSPMIPGLANALTGLKEGDRRTIMIPPDKAYGLEDEEAYRKIKRSQLPFDFQPAPGMVVDVQTQGEEPVSAIIWEVYLEDLLLNFNHPLAGKTLEFDVVVINIR